jgi:DNA end-binding protein Ku
MKSVWKGSLSFGLVSIPVQLFTAHETQALGFHVLHDKCLTRLVYHRWCPHCKKTVTWENTVKGIEKSDGSYFVLTQEAIKALRPKKSEEIAIVEFVDAEQVPVIYFNHHYYVAPAKKESSAFALFVKALESVRKIAIGRFVMRDKEYVCALQTMNSYLVLTTLYYAHEVRGLEKTVLKEKTAIRPAELKLAQEMIRKLSVKTFDISEFKDTFAQEIKKMLQKKGKKTQGKKPKKSTVKHEPKRSSLTESLRASLKTIKQPTAYAKKR